MMTEICKYGLKAFLVCTIACGVLAACRKESPSGLTKPQASDEAIAFSAGTPWTKGAPQLSTLERLAAQHFSVNAWYTPDGDTFGTASLSYIRNHRFGCTDIPSYTSWRGITSGGMADPVYYPLDGSLSFFCYAPYRADVSGTSDVHFDYEPAQTVTDQLTNYMDGSPLICFTPSASPSSQIDFIAATPVLDVVRSGGPVPLDFTNHLTTDIQFWCKYTGSLNENEGVMISQMVIRDVISSEYLYFTESAGMLGFSWCSTVSPEDGGAVMPVSSYSLSTVASDLITENPYLSSSEAKHVNNTINGRLYLLPQTLPAGAFLDLTYVVKNTASGGTLDENTVSIPLSGTAAWPMGKTVKYTITIGVAERKDVTLSTSITDWADAGNSHTDQELLY